MLCDLTFPGVLRECYFEIFPPAECKRPRAFVWPRLYQAAVCQRGTDSSRAGAGISSRDAAAASHPDIQKTGDDEQTATMDDRRDFKTKCENDSAARRGMNPLTKSI